MEKNRMRLVPHVLRVALTALGLFSVFVHADIRNGAVPADDYVRHDLRASQVQPGPAGQAQVAADFRRAFPDIVFSVDLIVGDGDLVVARWTATGTHLGKWGSLEPTGKAVKFSGVNIFRFRAGKVVEIWNHRDDLGLMQQIGAL
jgi:predicted ester cyclase